MKKLLNVILLAVIIPAIVFTGCKDDPAPVPAVGDFNTLSTYMINQNLDLPALLDGWVIDAKLNTLDGGIVDSADGYSIPDWTVFDIRSAADFALGHIKGSVNVTLSNIIQEANAINNNDTKILVVCYTGQTAGRAVMALRLSGFPNAKVMKFGFSAWSNNADFDKWSAKESDQAVGNPNWVSTASPDLPTNAFPTWTTTSTDAATILDERVNEMLAKSGWGIDADVVLGATTEYSIYNFWVMDDYTTFGHYAGAYQYKPISLANDVVSAMNPENSNLIYCYTGQTSSFIVAWLHVLGYNSQSVKFGVNNLSYTALNAAGKPHWHFPYHEYEYVVSK